MYLQHLAEALGPLSKEKDKLLANHDELKIRLNHEYEDLAEQKRSYQLEAEALFKMNSKIKE